jgi:hypothetical protein
VKEREMARERREGEMARKRPRKSKERWRE